MIVRTKFEVRTLTPSWDNRGYSKNLGSPWICPHCLFSKILNGLLFGWTLWMFQPNLKFTALHVLEIIVIEVLGVANPCYSTPLFPTPPRFPIISPRSPESRWTAFGLIVHAISFQDFQPMWSWSTNVTDRQTDRQTYRQTDGRHAVSIPRQNTMLCTIVHRAEKLYHCVRCKCFLPLQCFYLLN